MKWCSDVSDADFNDDGDDGYVSFSLKNIDNEALSEGLRLENAEALKTVAAQMTLSVHTLGLHSAEVLCPGFHDAYLC